MTFAGVGTHAVTAVYNGDANFSGSTSPILTQTIGQGSTTVALASSPQGVVVAGYAVTFTATIAPAGAAGGVPTGSVAFMDGTAPIPGCGAQAVAGGVAQCTVSYAGAGVHMVSAVYGGDQDFAGSTSPSVAMTVSSDPLVPDTGAGSTQTVLSGLAIAGGLLLLILGTFVRRRSRSAA